MSEIIYHLDRPLLPTTIHSGSGLLTDGEIRSAIGLGMLLRDALPENAKYASYELRIGQKLVYLVPDAKVAAVENYEEKTRTLAAGEKLYASEQPRHHGD